MYVLKLSLCARYKINKLFKKLSEEKSSNFKGKIEDQLKQIKLPKEYNKKIYIVPIDSWNKDYNRKLSARTGLITASNVIFVNYNVIAAALSCKNNANNAFKATIAHETGHLYEPTFYRHFMGKSWIREVRADWFGYKYALDCKYVKMDEAIDYKLEFIKKAKEKNPKFQLDEKCSHPSWELRKKYFRNFDNFSLELIREIINDYKIANKKTDTINDGDIKEIFNAYKF